MIFTENDKQTIINIISEASIAIMKIYNQPIEIISKDDQSPLTQADLASNQLLNTSFFRHFPHIPIISEENKETDYLIRKNYEYCWLIDPLDGTKEFIKRNGEFTVNVALIKNGVPIYGLIVQPTTGIIWHNLHGYIEKVHHQSKTILNTDARSNQDLNDVQVIASRSHLNDDTLNIINKLKEFGYNINLVNVGSALKFSLICENKAHIYPRLAPTMEWDTAAGQSLLNSFGGVVLDLSSKQPMLYNKECLLNNSFIALHPALQHIAKELM